MYFISSNSINGKYGITDTKDGVQEFYRKRDILEMVKGGLNIIGVYYWNHIEAYAPKFAVYYTLNDCDGTMVSLTKCYLLERLSDSSRISVKGEVLTYSMAEVAQLKMAGYDIRGFEKYYESITFNQGDTVVFGRRNMKPFIVKAKFVPSEEEYSKRCDFFIDQKDPYQFKYFESDIEVFNFCRANNLIIANEFFTQGSDSFWAAAGHRGVLVDRVIWLSNHFLELCYTVTVEFVGTLDNLYERATGIEHLTTEYGTGSYNPKGKCFHFSPYKCGRGSAYTISFEVGTSEPGDSPILENYDWRKHLDKYGVCITRANKHAQKKYASDIEFYAK